MAPHRRSRRRRAASALALAALLSVASCGRDETDGQDTRGRRSGPVVDQRFPDVVAVDARLDEGAWTFAVTISSPYDSPRRYADGWRIKGADGTVYGEHHLAHDHAAEQPFTRTQTGVRIPTAVTAVTVEGRDSKNGYGGQTRTVVLTGTGS